MFGLLIYAFLFLILSLLCNLGNNKKIETNDYKILCYSNFVIENSVNSDRLSDKIKFIIKPIAILKFVIEEDYDLLKGIVQRKRLKIESPERCFINNQNFECYQELERYLPIGSALFKVSSNSYEKIVEVLDYPLFENMDKELPFSYLPFVYGKSLIENIDLSEDEFLLTNDVNLSKQSKQIKSIIDKEAIDQLVKHFKDVRKYEIGLDPREIIKPYSFYSIRFDKKISFVLGQFEIDVPNISKEYITLSYEIVGQEVKLNTIKINKIKLNRPYIDDTLYFLPKVIEVLDIDFDGQNEILCKDSTNFFNRFIYFKKTKNGWTENLLSQEIF